MNCFCLLVVAVPVISKVHDAYIIAVEENARRKLEDASANHRVVPIDMTKAPLEEHNEEVTSFRAQTVHTANGNNSVGDHKANNQGGTLVEELPAKFRTSENVPAQEENRRPTSLPFAAQTGSSHVNQRQKQVNGSGNAVTTSHQSSVKSQQPSLSPVKPLRQQNHQRVESAPPSRQTEPPLVSQTARSVSSKPAAGGTELDNSESTGSAVVGRGVSDKVSMPVAEKKRKTGSSLSSSNGGSLEALEMNGMMERERESPRKGKGKGKNKGDRNSKSNPDTLIIEDMMQAPNGKASSHQSLDHTSLHDLSTVGYDLDSDIVCHSEQNSFSETAPHREMAIDCPDSFIATVKSPPRYPPPQPSLAPQSTTTGPRVPPTTPSRTAVSDKSRTDATLSDAALAVAGTSQPKPTAEQLERLRHHQEELRKRREEETRQAQEQEFLRSSLRGSAKLQALENRRQRQAHSPPPAGIDNAAFMDMEEDDEGELVDDVDGVELSMPSELYLRKNTGQFQRLFLCSLFLFFLFFLF
jgi:hypothetical protein